MFQLAENNLVVYAILCSLCLSVYACVNGQCVCVCINVCVLCMLRVCVVCIACVRYIVQILVIQDNESHPHLFLIDSFLMSLFATDFNNLIGADYSFIMPLNVNINTNKKIQ